MFKPDKRLKKMYDKFNALYWDGRLPQDVTVGWSDKLASDGDSVGVQVTGEYLDVQSHTIGIDINLRKTWTFVKSTLLHEMAHLAVHPYEGHGRIFDEEMLRIAIRGAFHDVW